MRIRYEWNYKNAFAVLGMNPEKTSLREINKHINTMEPYNYSLSDVKKAYEAANFLKKNNPENDGLDDMDILLSLSHRDINWQEYYEKYHIYYEQVIKNLRTLRNVSFVIGTAFAYTPIKEIVNNDTSLTGAVCAMIAYSSFLISVHAFFKENDETNTIIKRFRKQYDKQKSKGR